MLYADFVINQIARMLLIRASLFIAFLEGSGALSLCRRCIKWPIERLSTLLIIDLYINLFVLLW